MWVALVVLVVVALGGLAWWSSGRSRRPFPGVSADHETARGLGTLQGQHWRGDQHGNQHGW